MQPSLPAILILSQQALVPPIALHMTYKLPAHVQTHVPPVGYSCTELNELNQAYQCIWHHQVLCVHNWKNHVLEAHICRITQICKVCCLIRASGRIKLMQDGKSEPLYSQPYTVTTTCFKLICENPNPQENLTGNTTFSSEFTWDAEWQLLVVGIECIPWTDGYC